MKLTLIENLVVCYWRLMDIHSFRQFEHWKYVGLQEKYAFEKVKLKL